MRLSMPFLLGWLVMCAPAHAIEEKLQVLPTRGEVTQSFLLLETQAPVGVVVLFAGGHGRLGLAPDGERVRMAWGRNNFLVRTRELFAERGFHVVLMDAPSDRQGDEGMFHGFRTSESHWQDLAVVLNWLEKRYALPVWLVGTSRGTESVAFLGLKAGTVVQGLVLSAPVTRTTHRGASLLELALERIHVPVLMTAHRQDTCGSTPPEGVEELRAALVNAPRVRVQWWEGGDPPRGEPCQGLTPHGFLGIEVDVVEDMTRFMARR